ncbi:hypothetical protein SGLAM104S_03327 [Streptomyces glaucescens]
MTFVPTPVSGERCEATIDSPTAAAIDDRASSSGTAAMVSEPKTSSRVISVTGSVIFSDRARSSPRCRSTPLLMEGDPVSASSSSGWARWTAPVSASSASTLSLASRSSPFRATSTRRVRPSAERTGAATAATSGSRSIRAVTSRAAVRAAASSRAPERAEISTCSVGRRSRPPCAAIASARPASPTR